ncbi:prepilin peptidase [Marinobacter sp. HN1S83]|uniref:A24 family peptidase n=1 Tax=Marinobacter sp. HN1S83 TaxID=3382301 RepID=UPI00387ACB1B
MDGGAGITAILISGLVAAVVFDCSESRIPNWLIVCLAVVGIVLHTWMGHLGGLLQALAGLLVGLLCFLPFYVFGAMGAGDVKLLAAVGVLIGPAQVAFAAILTVIAGGVIALIYITVRGGLLQMIRRYRSMLMSLATMQPRYIPPAPGEAAGLRFPYALAIACGTALAVI